MTLSSKSPVVNLQTVNDNSQCTIVYCSTCGSVGVKFEPPFEFVAVSNSTIQCLANARTRTHLHTIMNHRENICPILVHRTHMVQHFRLSVGVLESTPPASPSLD